MSNNTPTSNIDERIDELVAELPIVHQFGCPALEYSDGGLRDYTCHCGNSEKAKAAVKALVTDVVARAMSLQARKDYKFISDIVKKLDPSDDPLNVEYALKMLRDWQHELAALSTNMKGNG